MFLSSGRISTISTYVQRTACMILLGLAATGEVRPACESGCFTGATDWNTATSGDWQASGTVCIHNANTATATNGCGGWTKSPQPICSGHKEYTVTKMDNAIRCCLGSITGDRGENIVGSGTPSMEVYTSYKMEDVCVANNSNSVP